jgi:hypothetical protein
MPKQTHALWLADALEAWTLGGKADTQLKAAAELRRLHAVNQKLLDALNLAMLDWENMRVVPSASRAHKAARAVIARAKGKV